MFGSFYAVNPVIRPQVFSFLEYAHNHGAILYYDVNFRSSHRNEVMKVTPNILENLELADIVRGSQEDFEVMFNKKDAETVYRAQISFYCKNFIYTQGGSPIEMRSAGGLSKQYPVAQTETVSTIGAGDNFNAGFIYGLVKYGITRDQIVSGMQIRRNLIFKDMMISDTIKYIGVDDLDIDLFESQYVVPEGMSYNSYLIDDEKIAVMDTADRRKGEEWKTNLKAALNGRQPDYLVAHHMEPDHAALIAEMLETYPGLQLVCSAQAVKMLPNFFDGFNFEGRVITVKEGDTLLLGQHTLQFISAAMVHWPEVIMSYDSKDKVLFSADGFGKFGALVNETDDWACEARRYYFNICGKYGTQVQSVVKKMAAIDVQTICPLHGPVLKGEALAEAVKLYDTWSKYEPESEGVLIAYASIHGGTAVAAERLGEILREKGAKKVVVSDLSRDDMAEVIEDAFRYPTVVVAASSYDAGVFPVMHDFLYHLQIKNYQRRRFGIVENGSWMPTAGKVMRSMIEALKDCEIVEPMVTIRSRMKAADEAQLEQLADSLLS